MAEPAEERGEGPPGASRFERGLLLALAFLLLGLGGAMLGRRLSAGRVAYSEDPRLDRAVRALIADKHSGEPSVIVNLGEPRKLQPLAELMDRAELARLALEAWRRDGQPSRERTDEAVRQVATSLKLEPGRARLTAYALGWPWAGPEHSQPPREARLCRQALAGAFDTAESPNDALDALARHCALAPEQAEAVLAARAAVELAGAGQRVLPALRAAKEAATSERVMEALEVVRGKGNGTERARGPVAGD
jgi:hypothetical protein